MRQYNILLFVLPFLLILQACSSNQELNYGKTEAGDEAISSENNTTTNKGDANMAENVTFPQLTTEVGENEQLVQMNTNVGSIKIKLFPEQAPRTVENFLTHAKNGYYNGIIFHRVIEDFMIQGGDPTGTGRGGESIYGQPFEDEFSMELFNLRGALSMANAGPGTNGSQFFIVQNASLPAGYKEQMGEAGFPEEIIEAYVENGGTPHLDHRHTVFGQVIEGMETVDKIAKVEKDQNDKPLENVVIESIDIIKE